MRKVFELLFILTFFAALWFPLLDMAAGILPRVKLHGKTAKEGKQKAKQTDFFDGSFQNHFERQFKHKLSARRYLIKSDNQLNMSLFHQASSSYSSQVVLGEENHLIERGYLAAENRLDLPQPERIQKRVERLSELQQALSKHNIPLIILVSPSKVGLYPELLPDAFRLELSDAKPTGYELMIPLLREKQIPVVDGKAILQKAQTESDYRFFSTSGTHWNAYGACLVAKELFATLEGELSRTLRRHDCSPVVLRETPRKPERDLAELLNVWFPESTYEPTPYPATSVFQDGYQPNMLFVGTSFLWGLYKPLDRHKIYKSRDMYYYYSRNFKWPGRKRVKLDKEALDWEGDILQKDAIVLEANESRLHRIGYGFVGDALAYFGNE